MSRDFAPGVAEPVLLSDIIVSREQISFVEQPQGGIGFDLPTGSVWQEGWDKLKLNSRTTLRGVNAIRLFVLLRQFETQREVDEWLRDLKTGARRWIDLEKLNPHLATAPILEAWRVEAEKNGTLRSRGRGKKSGGETPTMQLAQVALMEMVNAKGLGRPIKKKEAVGRALSRFPELHSNSGRDEYTAIYTDMNKLAKRWPDLLK